MGFAQRPLFTSVKIIESLFFDRAPNYQPTLSTSKLCLVARPKAYLLSWKLFPKQFIVRVLALIKGSHPQAGWFQGWFLVCVQGPTLAPFIFLYLSSVTCVGRVSSHFMDNFKNPLTIGKKCHPHQITHSQPLGGGVPWLFMGFNWFNRYIALRSVTFDPSMYLTLPVSAPRWREGCLVKRNLALHQLKLEKLEFQLLRWFGIWF